MPTTRETTLGQQFDFLLELDRLKSVTRQSSLANGCRRENSAEHSWHLAMFALVLSEHVEVQVDAAHAAKLLLVHDIVEIDAGDAPIHANGGSKSELKPQSIERLNAYLGCSQLNRPPDFGICGLSSRLAYLPKHVSPKH